MYELGFIKANAFGVKDYNPSPKYASYHKDTIGKLGNFSKKTKHDIKPTKKGSYLEFKAANKTPAPNA